MESDKPAAAEKKQVSGQIQRDRLEAKEKRKNIVHPKDKCFKCQEKPTIAYRNGLVCCK